MYKVFKNEKKILNRPFEDLQNTKICFIYYALIIIIIISDTYKRNSHGWCNS